MWDFSIGSALGAMRRTAPFIAFRLIIYFGIGLACSIGIGAGAGTGYLLTSFADEPGSGAGIGGFVGFGVVSVVLYWAREYLLYLVKAGHIAVLVKLMDGEALPGGRGQIDYAQGIVRERFQEASVLFALDQIIKGVLPAHRRTGGGIGHATVGQCRRLVRADRDRLCLELQGRAA